jgi:2,4-dienoyl-CoA reductase-like NADH-dependent reductase (Old Yellow Enzyme family)
MTKKTRETTRRDFLKTTGAIAGTVLLSDLSALGAANAQNQNTTGSGKGTSVEGRANYKIFSPGQIGTMKVKNRLVRSATMISAAERGRPTDEYIQFYRRLALGGVGVITTGFMIPTEDDAGNRRQIFIYDDDLIKGLQQVAEAVHRADKDCRLVAQIGHSGETVSPSGIRWPFPWKRAGRALTGNEVDAVVKDFAEAIRRVKTAGFDGVELHGAHAFLLSSFLSPLTNKRTDQYGGSPEKRVQIIWEIMDQARKRVGPDFPIMIKLNSDDNASGGIGPDNFPALVTEILKTGIAAINVSGNDCLKQNIRNVKDEAYFFSGAKALENKVPIILTGGNRSVDHMEELLKTSEVDFMGLARPLIREPDLPNRWLIGTGGNKAACISCNGCFGVITQGRTAYCIQESKSL